MAVCYDWLFHLIIDRHITNAQLITKAGLAQTYWQDKKKNEYLSLESIEKLFCAMECSVDDILEFQENGNDNRYRLYK